MAITRPSIKPGSVSISFNVNMFPADFPTNADVSYAIMDLDDQSYTKFGFMQYAIPTGSMTADEIATAISGAICLKEGI